ncbi:MAG: site-specific DNA-methyltransferase, partial [Acidobacteriota bacterium]
MEKLKMHSPDLTAHNIDRIAELFPTVVTETVDAEGTVSRNVDFDLLRQELSDHIVEGPQERYQLDWPGKREALFLANAPIAKTLRPVREESVDFDTTQNLFIEGDNLDALKLLQESYLGKFKLIYIDPPYNTGNDFVYSDDFAESNKQYLARSSQVDGEGNRLVANTESNGRFHSDWLSMMYPRLKMARNLLSDDGVIMVSIDENEHSNLVALGKEVLGRDAYCGEIVLKNSSRNDQRYISMQHEYIVFFVKNRIANRGLWFEKKGGLDQIYAAFAGFRREFGDDWESIRKAAQTWYKRFPPSDPIHSSKHYTRMDERGVYFADNISGPNDGQYVYDVAHPLTNEPCKRPARGWVFPQESMQQKIAAGYIHFGPDHSTVPNLKTYLKDTESQSLTSIRFVDGRAASKRLRLLFGEKVFTNPKDEF